MNLQLATIIVLLFLSAFFSATETAFTSLSFLQIRLLETAKGRSSRLAAALAKKQELLLTTILVGNNIANLTASALTTSYAISIWGNETVGITTGILTLLILLFGEITPKQLAIAHNTAIARLTAYPIRFFAVVFFPVVIVIKWMSSCITRLFATKKEKTLSVEGLMHVVDVAEDEGIVDEYETSLVQRVLHFSEATVKSIMTHRTEVFSIRDDQTLREAFTQIVASGYSRIPVYYKSPENITGILLVRDVLGAEVSGRLDEPVSHFTLSPIFVPETRKVKDMLFQFKRDKLQLAVVLDEYGGLSGVVSLEDIVEQLFGELYDEHETGAQERIHEEDGAYLIQADTSMQQIKDELDSQVRWSDASCTLAAYLIEELGTIPVAGDSVETPFGTFTISSMKGNRIETARLVPKPPEQD
ncbi:MAG: hemolysin family protein [Sphaerochaetaceae bacterium]